MFGIPAVLILGALAVWGWRRQHRHGLVLLWGVLFGVFLGGVAPMVLHSVTTGVLTGVGAGLSGLVHGLSQAFQ